MEFLAIYLISYVLCFCIFLYNNYLVKIKKLDHKWRIEAEAFWFIVLFPILNSVFFILFLFRIIFYTTKNFIEQN